MFRNYENAFKKKSGTTQWKTMEPDYVKATFKMPLGKSERWMQLELSASEMMEQLDKNGFVALYGIQFDTGKDELKPESEPLLEEIARLLSSNAALKRSVEGHTDNVGQKKANEALSKKRAESVKKWPREEQARGAGEEVTRAGPPQDGAVATRPTGSRPTVARAATPRALGRRGVRSRPSGNRPGLALAGSGAPCP